MLLTISHFPVASMTTKCAPVEEARAARVPVVVRAIHSGRRWAAIKGEALVRHSCVLSGPVTTTYTFTAGKSFAPSQPLAPPSVVKTKFCSADEVIVAR